MDKKKISGELHVLSDDALVEGLIKESYQLIASKLPKAIRSKYL